MATQISAALVKELRERTGAGMMECKHALESSQGNIEKAIEVLRKSGQAKADKKAGRVAAEGAIAIAELNGRAVMLEVNSETDFAARDENFIAFIQAVAKAALESKSSTLEALSDLTLNDDAGGYTVEDARKELIAKIGENVQLRRMVITSEPASVIGSYLHGKRIGVLVELDTENNQELARDIAMHIAASKPLVISPEDVPTDVTEKEKEIYMAQAEVSGKPPEILEKMVAGKLKKYLDEISLLGQPFVKDPDMTVGTLLNKHRAKILAFYRFEVGEGIEKNVSDFKSEVMSQVQNG